jgi:hypothetical protein
MPSAIVLYDPQGHLTQAEQQRLSSYIPAECHYTREILSKLTRIFVFDWGATDWKGAWEAIYQVSLVDGEEIFNSGQILLNAQYFGVGPDRLREIEDTLCHEYAHHWTMCYHLDRVYNGLQHRYVMLFYHYRNMPLNTLNCHLPSVTYAEWLRCDKEVVAEDFKVQFTPCKNHAMVNTAGIGKPPPALQDYLGRLYRLGWF